MRRANYFTGYSPVPRMWQQQKRRVRTIQMFPTSLCFSQVAVTAPSVKNKELRGATRALFRSPQASALDAKLEILLAES